MKKLLSIILVICLLLLCGCANKKESAETNKENFILYASFYPLYALSASIITDVPGMEVHQLIAPQDGCLRNYSFSDWDLTVAVSSDAVIIGGRGLEGFEGILEQLGEEGPSVLKCMYYSDLLGQEETAGEDDNHFIGANPWLFLSVSGAKELLASISGGMQSLDEPYSELYTQNLEKYISKLEATEEEINLLLQGKLKCNVVVLHEGLIYPANDLGLTVACKIERESGTDLSDNELATALQKIDDSGTDLCLIEKQAPIELVKALEEHGLTVIKLDTMSTCVESLGIDYYYDTLKSNAQLIISALPEE